MEPLRGRVWWEVIGGVSLKEIVGAYSSSHFLSPWLMMLEVLFFYVFLL
jgi:hypothetical protein